MSNCSGSDNYSNYRDLACAIIHDGIKLYKKAIRQGGDLSVTRRYLSNPFYTDMVLQILHCSVDDMLNALEANYDKTKTGKYDKGIIYGKAMK